MRTRVAYGDTGLWLDVPDDSTIVTPSSRPAAADQRQAVRDALRRPVAGPPLRERVRRGQTVAISACDITRPQPRKVMVPAVLEELDGLVDLGDVVTGAVTVPADRPLVFKSVGMAWQDLVVATAVLDHAGSRPA